MTHPTLIVMLLLSGCAFMSDNVQLLAFEYEIPDRYRWIDVEKIPDCKGTIRHWEWGEGYRHYTNSVPCAKHLGFSPPRDYTMGERLRDG